MLIFSVAVRRRKPLPEMFESEWSLQERRGRECLCGRHRPSGGVLGGAERSAGAEFEVQWFAEFSGNRFAVAVPGHAGFG